jgi:hypothetical protein
MTWDEVRHLHPERWLLIEALQAHTEGTQRIVEDISVAGVFDDSLVAMHRYKDLHHDYPMREFYVVHSSRETLDITERVWLGIRRA